MTKADIVSNVSNITGLTKVEIEYVLEGILSTISDSLVKANIVSTLQNFDEIFTK